MNIDLTTLTPTQLLKLINDIDVKHSQTKQEIVNHTYEIEQIEKSINEKVQILEELEKDYVEVIEEMNKK